MLGLDLRLHRNSSRNGAYVYGGENKTRSILEQAKYLADLASRYPNRLDRDGMSEDDMDG